MRSGGLPVGPRGKERVAYEGDYLVHENIGVCRYKRAVTSVANGSEWEAIELEFADGVVEVARIDSRLLTRFRAGDSRGVKLSRYADASRWLRAKEKVATKVRAQAVDVMALYARRAGTARAPCAPDGPDYAAFCARFPHAPTPDQARCMEEIEQDMVWRQRPMDRLLCGDVGFGKTEVAMRAIYRAVRNGRQVALLAPTTILAAQHYRTLLARLPSDMRVELLRGGNTRDARDIKVRMAEGTVDVVVGTHTLLGRKVEFSGLGLLVVDEEQKFGVHQKERLKALATGVDVLTLTATPIPRTLHMSLSGIRDLSIIQSPPEGRLNVTTYIMKSTDEVIQRAVARELRRKGQVFFIVPRISDIDAAAARLHKLAPAARVVVGHSKVRDLEERVLNFTLGIGDVLVATSIIENGIDMPNVNSIIIQDSHMFGLSQLYQMRGRVGRSDKAAYTYLLYGPDVRLTADAKRRLKALRELSTLGSGYELANRDLEIRGAGSVFGTDQSGDVGAVGYELYMNMLEAALADARGTSIQAVLKCHIDLGLDLAARGSVPTDYIPLDVVAQEVDRLRVARGYGDLVDIAQQWVNTYGPLPPAARALFAHHHVLAACRRLGVETITLDDGGGSGAAAARLTGPETGPALWAPLLEKGALKPALRARVAVHEDAVTVAFDGAPREEWVDALLDVLLPLAQHVEAKQQLLVEE
ncbi:P-loop containing nucleoside triphosphate hydrolase protein [Tribonema minus]|uniref:P-loop containing nucleoside triphosphate hydrolase protein n=1 Tax=Tribonema minus TaxID=303371 RepID=A0A835YLF5_9STRA|nr:P-loop containing nucleoside triphosphate hydrolase protein [Tribonema minus]